MNNDHDKSIDELEKELTAIKRQFQFSAIAALSILAVGMVFYHYVEKLGFIDDIYFCVITLTTVGYGDITPHTDPGKIFTVFYVLAGIGIIAGFANGLLRRSAVATELRRAQRRKETK